MLRPANETNKFIQIVKLPFCSIITNSKALPLNYSFRMLYNVNCYKTINFCFEQNRQRERDRTGKKGAASRSEFEKEAGLLLVLVSTSSK